MNPPPKTVVATNGKPGRPKPPFDPYVEELARILNDNSVEPPSNLNQAADHLENWGKINKEELLGWGIVKPLQKSAIRKRLDKRFKGTYKHSVEMRKLLPAYASGLACMAE